MKSFDIDINYVVFSAVPTSEIITRSIQKEQRESVRFFILKPYFQAKLMLSTLEHLNMAIAGALQKVLISDGPVVRSIVQSLGRVAFCRMNAKGLEKPGTICKNSGIFISNVSTKYNQSSLMIRVGLSVRIFRFPQTSSISSKLFKFFNEGHRLLKTDVVSFSIYSYGIPVQIFSEHSSIRVILMQNSVNKESEIEDDLEDNYTKLPDPVQALDGSWIYQPLLMRSYQIDNEDAAFVFQLIPNETSLCPQYLVVARFIIPPDLFQIDDYGQFYWTMLPSSSSSSKDCSKLYASTYIS